MKNFGVTTDLVLDSLKGRVSSTDNLIYLNTRVFKGLEDHILKEYNSRGQKIKSTYYTEDGKARQIQIIMFDSNANRTGYVNYDENKVQTSRGHYELDSYGRKIREYHDGKLEESYKYDSSGNIIEVYYNGTGGKDLYEYDAGGLATKQLTAYSGESTSSSRPNASNNQVILFSNDKWGNIVEMKVFNLYTKNLVCVHKSDINSFGDEIEKLIYDSNGMILNRSSSEYEYDEFGNWTTRRFLNKDNQLYREHVRTIFYDKR